jgi:hypothetical protein
MISWMNWTEENRYSTRFHQVRVTKVSVNRPCTSDIESLISLVR